MESEQDAIRQQINLLQQSLDDNDAKRLLLSNVKNLDISSLKKRQSQLEKIVDTINKSDQEYETLSHQYHDITSQLQQCQQQLDVLDKANAQYMKTMSEIEVHSNNDEVYRIIAEATSSTKGKPVITIRETVNRALNLTNQLLHVMYEDEIQLLKPMIDETEFTLPFRCGINHSPDIRYGSQSENTLLSLALSLSLASSITPYNVYLIDEIDAYLDQAAKDGFVQMLQEIMVRLNSEQIFIISHSVCADQYPDYVQTINISERIKELK
jgi:DNA repair exonuclease SbcCD ATPase subunit